MLADGVSVEFTSIDVAARLMARIERPYSQPFFWLACAEGRSVSASTERKIMGWIMG